MKITTKDLEVVCERINNITNGKYHLDGAYGGYALHCFSKGGGSSDIFKAGHMTKKDLYNRMQAFISGLESSK